MHKSALLSILMHGTAISLIVAGLPQFFDDKIVERPPMIIEIVPDGAATLVPPPSDPGSAQQPVPVPSSQDDAIPFVKAVDKAEAVDAAAPSMQSADAAPAPAPVNDVRINQASDIADAGPAQPDDKPEALEELKQVSVKPIDTPKAEPKKAEQPKIAEIKKPEPPKPPAVKPPEPPKPAVARKPDSPAAPAKRAPDQVAYNNAAADKKLSEHQWRDKDLSMLEGCWVLGRNSEATLAEGSKVLRGVTRAGRLCFDQSGVGTRELVQEFPDDPRLVCRAPIRAVFTNDGRLLTTQPAVTCEPRSSKVTWNGPPNALDCVRQNDSLAICSDAQGNQHEFRRSGL